MVRFGSGCASAVLLALVGLGASPLRAEDVAPAATSNATQPAGTAVRRDPDGKTGISPMMEAIVRGDAALLARDFPTATAAYQEAIKAAPQRALGHLRMASLHLSLGQLDEATEVLAAAERFTGGDATLTVQTLALKAMLLERRAAWSDATLAFSAYAMLGRAGSAAGAEGLVREAIVTTCADRKTVIARVTERQAAYAKVRERIEKDLAEAQPSSGSTAPPAK
jgi:tetratricopeptide (TPR) repeat protein